MATNEATGYRIEYFEHEDYKDIPSKRKGAIPLCGYSVNLVNEPRQGRKIEIIIRVRTHWNGVDAMSDGL